MPADNGGEDNLFDKYEKISFMSQAEFFMSYKSSITRELSTKWYALLKSQKI